jgi:hypothetical protein
MSIDAGLTLHLRTEATQERFLSKLLFSNWKAEADGFLYTPLGGDAGDWEREQTLNKETVLELFREKKKREEFFAISLEWGETEVGGSFLFFKSGAIVFSPMINRVMLPNRRTTDVSYYLSIILQLFNDELFDDLERWEWREST